MTSIVNFHESITYTNFLYEIVNWSVKFVVIWEKSYLQ